MHADSAHPLWQRVRHHPEDSDARRILGDWLSERDDPLGELITNAFASGPTATDRRAVLQRRLREVLFAGWRDVRIELSFEGGLPDHLLLSALPEAQDLSVRLEALLQHPAMTLLNSLHLDRWPDVQLRPTVTAIARSGPHLALRSLTLRSAERRRAGALDRLWPALPGLHTLDLATGDGSLIELPATLRRLTVATPQRPPLTPVPLDQLTLTGDETGWREWLLHPATERLGSLKLWGGGIGVLHQPFVGESTLTRLDLSDATVDDVTIRALTSPSRLPALRSFVGPAPLAQTFAARGVTTVHTWDRRNVTLDDPDDYEDYDYDTDYCDCGACDDCNAGMVIEGDLLETLEARYRRGEITWTELEASMHGDEPHDAESLWRTANGLG